MSALPARDDATGAAAATHDDVKLIGETHCRYCYSLDSGDMRRDAVLGEPADKTQLHGLWSYMNLICPSQFVTVTRSRVSRVPRRYQLQERASHALSAYSQDDPSPFPLTTTHARILRALIRRPRYLPANGIARVKRCCRRCRCSQGVNPSSNSRICWDERRGHQ